MNTKETLRLFVIMLAVLGIMILVYIKLTPAPLETIRQSFPIQGQVHIAIGATHPEYNSNPPTSGWHYAEAADWDVYKKELPDEQLVHNLEHGGIWISYKNISTTTINQIENVVRGQLKIIVTPRAKNDSPIVLASWGRLEKLQTFDEVKIREFINANRNKSPEPLAQ
ncbi:MAG: DUF3105 domain-containing protein [Candidatus Vogelbacteria bacterium]|nr:DUF3105 domain-containing protein [Candidatus Vogelbacteria bacterium]